MGLVVICGLLLRLYKDEFEAVAGSIRMRIASFLEITGQRGAVLLAAALVILVALLLSKSRGGAIATAIGLFGLGALTLKMFKGGSVGQRGAVIIVGFLLVGLTVLGFGDALVGRIAQQGLHDDSRIAVYTTAMRSIFFAPVLGYGYGTFADIFPMFRDQSVSTFGRWEMAHNTYLEVFQGLGVLFGSMLVGSVALLAWRCVRGAITREQNAMIPCVAASVSLLLGVHSLIDFSLQIQAVTVTFMALLGAGVAQAQSSRLLLRD
jgi:O-antigen ligase